MRIFITGATGYIGGAIADSARSAGHVVVGAAHNAGMESALRARGILPVRAELADLPSLRENVRHADAVIHAAFAAGPSGADIDRRATEAMVNALGSSDRPFIYTSGVWVLGPTGDSIADESTPTAPIALVAWRGPLEEWLREAAHRGVHAIIVRPGVVHGNGGGIPARIGRGELPLLNGGMQRWPVVHVEDLAELYLAALERAGRGSILHGISEVRAVRDLVGDEVTPLRTLTPAEARVSLGAFADALAIDQNVSSTRTQSLLNWSPARLPAAALDRAGAA